jgi:hypothetical protein
MSALALIPRQLAALSKMRLAARRREDSEFSTQRREASRSRRPHDRV